mgnify:CR=1 FL=1
MLGISGKLKCLEALGRWEECVEISNKLDFQADDVTLSERDVAMHTKSIITGATAAWSLNQWDTVDNIIGDQDVESVDAVFMKAVLSAHREEFSVARDRIDKTRELLDSQLSGLLAESYGRAYIPLVMLQQCSELEEVLEYKQFLKDAGILGDSVSLDSYKNKQYDSSNNLDGYGSSAGVGILQNASGDEETTQQLLNEAYKRKSQLADKWRKRIRGCRATGRGAIPVWRSLMNVRRMVLSDREDIDTCIEFAELCRNGVSYEDLVRISSGNLASYCVCFYLIFRKILHLLNVCLICKKGDCTKIIRNLVTQWFLRPVKVFPICLLQCLPQCLVVLVKDHWITGYSAILLMLRDHYSHHHQPLL